MSLFVGRQSRNIWDTVDSGETTVRLAFKDQSVEVWIFEVSKDYCEAPRLIKEYIQEEKLKVYFRRASHLCFRMTLV